MKFTNTPTPRVNAPEGTYAAVCVDFVEHGLKETSFGVKERVEFVFEVPHQHPDYARPLTVGARFNVSFHEKAGLRKFMEAWRGKKYTAEQVAEGVDAEAAIGRPALITVEHNEGTEATYANIAVIMPLPAGMAALTPSEDYDRVKDRDGGWDVRSPNSKAVKPAPATNRPAVQASNYVDTDAALAQANEEARRARAAREAQQPVAAGGQDDWDPATDGLPF